MTHFQSCPPTIFWISCLCLGPVGFPWRPALEVEDGCLPDRKAFTIHKIHPATLLIYEELGTCKYSARFICSRFFKMFFFVGFDEFSLKFTVYVRKQYFCLFNLVVIKNKQNAFEISVIWSEFLLLL